MEGEKNLSGKCEPRARFLSSLGMKSAIRYVTRITMGCGGSHGFSHRWRL